MKDTLMTYGVLVGKRFTRKQKLSFYKVVKERFEQKQRQISVWNKAVAFGRLNHIVVGDLSKASIILLASYDTPGKAWLPGFLYYPFDHQQNKQQEYRNLLWKFAVLILAMLGMIGCLYRLQETDGIVRVIRVILGALCGLAAFMASRESANPVNFNRCSASIALLDELADEIQDERLAIVFLDRTAGAITGYQVLPDKIDRRANIVLLDCLASGETLYCGYGGQQPLIPRQDGLEPIQFVRCQKEDVPLLQLFPNALVLTLGTMVKQQVAVFQTRSKRDYDIQIERLEQIKRLCVAYVKEKLQ